MREKEGGREINRGRERNRYTERKKVKEGGRKYKLKSFSLDRL